MLTLSDDRFLSIRVACLTIALMLASHAKASAQADKNPPWLETLKNDKRLQVKMSIDLGPIPTVEAWFAAIKKETGVTLTLADPPTTGRIKLNGIIVAEPKLYAWGIMRAGATRDFIDPAWEKTDDGYRLHGKPNRILTPEEAKLEDQRIAARLEDQKKAAAKARKVLFDLPKGHPLRVDPKYNVPPKVVITPPPDPPGPGPHHADLRLRKRVTINLAQPKLDAALEKLRDTTGVAFARADAIPNGNPAMNGISVNGVPAWEVMDYIAREKKIQGRWEKDGAGYRLVPNGTPPVIDEEVAASPADESAGRIRRNLIIAAILALPVLLMVGFALFKGRRAKARPN